MVRGGGRNHSVSNYLLLKLSSSSSRHQSTSPPAKCSHDLLHLTYPSFFCNIVSMNNADPIKYGIHHAKSFFNPLAIVIALYPINPQSATSMCISSQIFLDTGGNIRYTVIMPFPETSLSDPISRALLYRHLGDCRDLHTFLFSVNYSPSSNKAQVGCTSRMTSPAGDVDRRNRP